MMFTLTCGQPVDVGLARAEVAALDRVVEQPVDAVAVVLVVLGRVDPALGGDAVRAARAVVVAEALDVVAQLAQRRRGRGAGQAGADDDDVVLPLVGRVDQLQLEAVPVPLLAGSGRRGSSRSSSTARTSASYRTTSPASTDTGMEMLPQRRSAPAIAAANGRRHFLTARCCERQRLRRAPQAVVEVQAQRQHAERRRASETGQTRNPVTTLCVGRRRGSKSGWTRARASGAAGGRRRRPAMITPPQRIVREA